MHRCNVFLNEIAITVPQTQIYTILHNGRFISYDSRAVDLVSLICEKMKSRCDYYCISTGESSAKIYCLFINYYPSKSDKLLVTAGKCKELSSVFESV